MTVSVHNPDQYMASLRQIIAPGRERIGLLVGAGAPAGIFPPGSDKPLIPAVAGSQGCDCGEGNFCLTGPVRCAIVRHIWCITSHG